MTPVLAALLLAVRSPVDVTLPFASPKGLIVVSAEGNGKAPLKLLIDTGAQRTVIDSETAKTLSLTEGEDVEARGAGGSVKAKFVKGLQLTSLGESSLDAVSVPLKAIGDAIGTHIDVIVGQDVLLKHVIEIDREKNTVTISAHRPIVSAAASVVSLSFRGGRPYVPATVVAPGGYEAAAELLLDTGSDTVAELSEAFARGIGLTLRPDPYGRSLLGVGGAVPLRVTEVQELRLGKASLASDDVRVFGKAENSAGDGDGRVGNGFLSRFRVTIDGPGRKLVLVEPKKS